MDEVKSPRKQPHVRFLVTCPCSGSIVPIKVFKKPPICAVTSELILRNNTNSTKISAPDYSILKDVSSHSVFINVVNSGKHWGIPYSETMLRFDQSLDSSSLYPTDCDSVIHHEAKLQGVLMTVEASSSLLLKWTCHTMGFFRTSRRITLKDKWGIYTSVAGGTTSYDYRLFLPQDDRFMTEFLELYKSILMALLAEH